MPAGGVCVSLLARAVGEEVGWRTPFPGGRGPAPAGGAADRLLAPRNPTAGSARPEGGLSTALFAGGRAGATLLLWAASLLTLLVMYLLLNWLPTLVVAKGYGPADGATASLAFNLVGIAGSLLLGLAADRGGVRLTMLAAYLALGAALWALGRPRSSGASWR